MELDVDPEVGQAGVLAIRRALVIVGTKPTSSSAGSAWQRAALQEAVARAPASRRYAPSPRSTRGATRA